MKICTALQNDVRLSVVAQTAVNESDALIVVMKKFIYYYLFSQTSLTKVNSSGEQLTFME